MMTSINYRYSNDDKKMELREVVMDKLGSSLTLAFVRTVQVCDLPPAHRSNVRIYVLCTPQLRREEAAEEDEMVPRKSYFQNTEGSANLWVSAPEYLCFLKWSTSLRNPVYKQDGL